MPVTRARFLCDPVHAEARKKRERVKCVPVRKYKEGLEQVGEAINELLQERKLYIERIYPYDQGRKVALIRMKGQLISEEFTPEGIKIKAYIPLSLYGAVEPD